MTNILLADPDVESRQYFKELFSANGINVVKECVKGEEVVDYLRDENPSMCIISLKLGGLDAFETINRVVTNHTRVPVIIQSGHSESTFPRRLLETGARAFISRESADQEVLNAVSEVSQGRKYISTELAQNIAMSLLPGSVPSPLDRLSEREMQIILQLSHGETAREISTRLALSPKTISTYKHRVREKLSLNDTQEMFKLVSEHGLR